jgi:Asp/Glu/hydantoin racemase
MGEMMAACLAFLHTSVVILEPVRQLANKLLPDLQTFHVVDESLLQEILRTGGLTSGVVRRIGRLAVNAEEAGASAIVLTCSSASPAVAPIQATLRAPFLAIDEAMAEQAVTTADRIGVLATVRTTIGPTQDLLKAKAAATGRCVEVLSQVSVEAFEALVGGDRPRHDALVSRACQDLSGKVGVIVFAQGSMAPLAERLQSEIAVPILTSLELGVRRAGEVARRQGAQG